MLGNSCQLAEKPAHSSSEVSYPPWTGTTNVFALSSASENRHVYVHSVTFPYTFAVKPKWQMAVLWIIATCSLAVAYLHKLIPLEHSTVDIPGTWGVWWQFSNAHMRRLRTTILNSSLNGNESTLVHTKFHLHSPIPICLSMFRLTTRWLIPSGEVAFSP